MANTYCNILLHLVFAVKHRDACISRLWSNELYAYLSASLRSRGSYPISIGGIDDHVHIFFSYNPGVPLPDLVRDLKSFSSKFINDRHVMRCKFEWQKGYACFSYSQSQVEAVKRYIEHQYEHHKGCTMVDEMKNMLTKFGVDYDEKYIFVEPD